MYMNRINKTTQNVYKTNNKSADIKLSIIAKLCVYNVQRQIA